MAEYYITVNNNERASARMAFDVLGIDVIDEFVSLHTTEYIVVAKDGFDKEVWAIIDAIEEYNDL